MEQRLDATYLRPGLTERAAALSIFIAGIGACIFLATWGISFLWRYTPPEIRIANPVLTLKLEQDKPFVFVPPEPLNTGPGATNGLVGEAKPPLSDAIKREVTVFWSATHGPGEVVTGWKYPDGRGVLPVHQYCYYIAPNADHSSKHVDIASNGTPSPTINGGLVPDLEGALAKCQWVSK